MSKCIGLTKKAKGQIKLLNKLSNGTLGEVTISGLNNNRSLDLNPDGSNSKVYDMLISSGFSEDSAILRRSVMYTQGFVKNNGRWFDNFTEEPTLQIGTSYSHSIPSVINLNKIITNVDKDSIDVSDVNNVERTELNGSPFKTYGEFDSAVDMLGTMIVKYVNGIQRAREELTKDLSKKKEILQWMMKHNVEDIE